jgi:hypothetical protein
VIQDRTLNGISIALGLLLTAYVAQDLHFNPRWHGDDGPGVGKLPREIVAGYMDIAYRQGDPGRAATLYFAPKAIDVTPEAPYRADGQPLTSTVRQVVAEGLNVAVHHCVDAVADQAAHEVVDMFRTFNGRIMWRKTIAQPLATGSCADSALGREVDLGLKPPPAR